MTSAICTDCNRSASAGNGLAPGKAAAPYGRSPHCRTTSLSGTLFLLCFSGRGPKSGVAAAGWNRIRLFYHLLPPFGNRLWAKFSAFCCLYRKTSQKTPSSPVLFSVICRNYCIFQMLSIVKGCELCYITVCLLAHIL